MLSKFSRKLWAEIGLHHTILQQFIKFAEVVHRVLVEIRPVIYFMEWNRFKMYRAVTWPTRFRKFNIETDWNTVKIIILLLCTVCVLLFGLAYLLCYHAKYTLMVVDLTSKLQLTGRLNNLMIGKIKTIFRTKIRKIL